MKAIADNMDFPDFVPTKRELLVLVEYWARQATETGFFCWSNAQFGSSDSRLIRLAWHQVDRISKLIGEEEVDKAVDKARTAVGEDAGNDIFWTIYRNDGSLEDVTHIEPQNAQEYCTRAWAHTLLNQSQDALNDYNAAITMEPKDPDMYYVRGQFFQHLEHYEQAVTDLDQAIRLDAEHELARGNRADCRQALGHLEDAMKDLTMLIRLDPDDARRHFKRGCIYEEMGREEEAQQDYARSVELGISPGVIRSSRERKYLLNGTTPCNGKTPCTHGIGYGDSASR